MAKVSIIFEDKHVEGENGTTVTVDVVDEPEVPKNFEDYTDAQRASHIVIQDMYDHGAKVVDRDTGEQLPPAEPNIATWG